MTKVNFVPKPGKPHIRLLSINNKSWILNPITIAFGRRLTTNERYLHVLAYDYCVKVNPYYSLSRGDAARALHNINRTKRVLRTLDAIGNNHD